MRYEWRTRRLSRRHLLALGVLMALLPLVLAAQAAGLDTNNPPSFAFVSDEDCSKPVNGVCPDDQPGQKDLNAHAIALPTPGDLWVAWKWDVTGLSGNNTGDACALFDTDAPFDGKVNSAICVTIGGSPAAQLTNSPRVYTCGNSKVDRCTTPITQVSPVNSACSTATNASDPFHANENDTQATCHVDLADVGATVAGLVNTCSYPSQQPNSDPSDCVLLQRDAFIRIRKIIDASAAVAFSFNVTPLPGNIGSNPALTHTFTSGGDTTLTSLYMPIQSGVNHSVGEVVASGWEIDTSSGNAPSCTGSNAANGAGSFSGTTISNIKANEDDQITCTFRNKLQNGAIKILKKSTKTGNPLVTTAGAEFCYSTSTGCSTTGVTDNGSGDSDSDTGEICIAGLAPGTYYVNETKAPNGYGGASQANQTAVAVAGTNCTSSQPSGTGVATFTNDPLADIQVNVRDQGSGETNVAGTTITCKEGTTTLTPSSTTPPTGWDKSARHNGLDPGTYVCTIIIDP